MTDLWVSAFHCLAITVVVGSTARGSLTRPGPPIELSDIEHSVHSELGPSDRTNVGISESASFWVDSQDIDEAFVGEAWVEEWDYVEVTWSSSGGTVTLYPLVGEYTDAYFDLCGNDESVTLKALAQNGPDPVAADPPVQKQKVMQKKVPNAVNVIGFIENQGVIDTINNAAGSNFGLDPDGTDVGAMTRFSLQVAPTDVDFTNLPVRENIKMQTFTWPDTSTFTRAAFQKSLTLQIATVNIMGTIVVQPNRFDDILAQIAPRAKLQKPNGMWENATFDVKVPYEFDTGAAHPNKWKEIVESTHKREFLHASFKGKMTLEASTTVSGTEQGPWTLQ